MPGILTIEEAARARQQATQTRADRPRERRNGPSAGGGGRARAQVRAQLTITGNEVRAAGSSGALHFHGMASVTGVGYEMWDMFGPYTEMVAPGAFAESLAQTDPPLDVPLVLQHDQLRRIARTLTGTLSLSEITSGPVTGLEVDAPNLDPNDYDVAYIVPKLQAGLIDEMSFAFMITRGSWSPDWMEFHIEQADIHRGDVAIVGFGANPYTTGGLRALQRIEDALRSGGSISSNDAEFIRQAVATYAGAEPARRSLDERAERASRRRVDVPPELVTARSISGI